MTKTNPRLFLLLAPMVVLAGCSDDSTSPELERSVFDLLSEVDQVEVTIATTSVDSAFVAADGTLQLGVVLREENGVTLSDRRTEWSSDDSSVATVDSMGLVQGEADGRVSIIATSEGVSDTITVRVIDCSVAGAAPDLEVGEVATREGPGAQLLCLAGAPEGAEYLYIPFNATDDITVNLAIEVVGGNVLPPTGGPIPALAPDGLWPNMQMGPGLKEDWTFHRRLREIEKRELAPRIGAGGGRPRNNAPLHGAAPFFQDAPAEGELIELNASLEACEDPDIRTGRVVAVTDHAIVVEDTAAPANGLTDAEYRSIGITFDTLSHPVDTDNFGDPSDIDDNGRAIIFYTPAVNELTEPNSNSFVGGFFYGRDLFPREETERLEACPTSNVAEMFYMLVADPGAEFGNDFSRDFILRNTQGTIAHEFQHLINASRRIYVNNASAFEEVWLNEGLSHIAEELVFYAASGLEPRQNIDLETLRSSNAILDAVNTYQISNLGRLITYLEDPDEESLLGVDNLPTRGAAWAFLRYAADQRDGPDQPFWFDLVNSTTGGVANLNRVLTEFDALDLMQTWTVSAYTDDAVPQVPLLYMQPSWNFRDILPVLTPEEDFPLAVRTLVSGEERTFSLRAGGAAFVRFGVAAGAPAILTTTSGRTIPPGNLRISVVRVR